jgi:toxin ParE1/3/4
MARIVYSQTSKDDLLEIWVGLAASNVSAAERLMGDLEAATQLLATQPLIGKTRREFGAGIRSFPVRGHVLVYRPIRGGVELVRVVHGARDLERVLSWRISEEVAICV